MWKLSSVLLACSLFTACAASTHSTALSALGVARSSKDLLAVIDQPGLLEVESVVSADWSVPRSGVINLGHPKAKAARLEDGDEPIQIYFHVVRHPTHGTFIIDTGVERALRDDPERSAMSGLVRSAMHLEKLIVHMPLGDWLANQPAPIDGVLMTHLHLDHVSGMPDVPKGTPIYAGPGETSSRQFLYMFTQGSIDRALEGQAPVQEWPFRAGEDRFAGVVDVFGDGSLWAIWVPGHTPGSVAYLARTATGPVLFVGDTSHTSWGWQHDVEPGSFTGDQELNAASLGVLRKLVEEHPRIDVRLGHQHLAAPVPTR
ncbi:MBL fold metallo-hydrolase [Vulgatibacter incomptus]|uniref:Beta-lactamase-like n=1 Tax=Vulgatibacter incomptus TaxID=1391653 RepID=A0A0K1PG17_9BACT|nr:MBL fold metallo-hydrolase [Vulgatibacter incomptus]AKU92478.1 Beta-lactamase-like [Vulgatibacter incomptus]